MFVYNSRFTALINIRKILRHQKKFINLISVGKFVRVIVAYHRLRARNLNYVINSALDTLCVF